MPRTYQRYKPGTAASVGDPFSIVHISGVRTAAAWASFTNSPRSRAHTNTPSVTRRVYATCYVTPPPPLNIRPKSVIKSSRNDRRRAANKSHAIAVEPFAPPSSHHSNLYLKYPFIIIQALSRDAGREK